MEPRKGNWLQTYMGKAYWPADPRPEDVHIMDIAHALANACRFGGHCSRFYSVAEHSVLVSHLVPPADALHGLLHDATEAYLVDVPRPVKMMLDGYKELEELNWRAIAARFGLDPTMPESVHDADQNVLLAERNALLGPSPEGLEWALGIDPHHRPANVRVIGLSPGDARVLFWNRFYELRPFEV